MSGEWCIYRIPNTGGSGVHQPRGTRVPPEVFLVQKELSYRKALIGHRGEDAS